jgi:dinuclear metal center YbgI/SA1388 family protein
VSKERCFNIALSFLPYFYDSNFIHFMPLLHSIIEAIEDFAPQTLQESYDNAGLLVGNPLIEINKALIALDCLESVIDEAIKVKANLVITHHPIIFSGIKSLTGRNYIEKVIIKAIKNDIAIYAAHTNLDNVKLGVNKKIAEKLELLKTNILLPKKNELQQLFVYVPYSHVELVKSALFAAGAGKMGNYTSCSFGIDGKGTYLANDLATPFLGRKNELHGENELKIEVLVPTHLTSKVIKALKNSHPYEEIAYGFIMLQNSNTEIGAGLIGELKKPLNAEAFLAFVKEKMHATCIRYTQYNRQLISKVAICGGSGSFLLRNAMQEADALVTADFKYHEFFEAENKILIADIGHYESEQFTSEIFLGILSEKFPNFAVQITSVNTNPIQYYYN